MFLPPHGQKRSMSMTMMTTVPTTTTTRLNDDDDDKTNNKNKDNYDKNKEEESGDVGDENETDEGRGRDDGNGNSSSNKGGKLTFSLSSSSSTKKKGTTGNQMIMMKPRTSSTTVPTTTTTGSTKNNGNSRSTVPAFSFGDDEDDDNGHNNHSISPDIPKPVLVIPLQKDIRKSLQEQAMARRRAAVEEEDQSSSISPVQSMELTAVNHAETGDGKIEQQQPQQQLSQADQAAVEALTRDAIAATDRKNKNSHGDEDGFGGTSKMVIQSTGDTFQRGGGGTTTTTTTSDDIVDHNNNNHGVTDHSENQLFQEELEQLPEDVPVESNVYKAIPIAEFGAAMLRGMGWSGDDDDASNNKNKNGTGKDPTTVMPRPSRLGLGAIPKLDAHHGTHNSIPATHGGRRPRGQDQFQKAERLKQQQEEYERERQRQIAMDKQRTVQVGSIVSVDYQQEGDSSRHYSRRRDRAMIRQLQGVPGLNMILVQFEGEVGTTKVKKGSVSLIERSELHKRPFQEAVPRSEETGSPRGDVQKLSRSRDNNEDDRNKRDERHTGSSTRSSAKDIYPDRNSSRQKDNERRDRRSKDDRRHRDRGDVRDTNNRDRDNESVRKDDRHRDKSDSRGNRDDETRKRDKSRSEKPDDVAPSKSSKRSRRDDDSHRRQSQTTTTWLIPNIRVRVISSKYGESVYKQKGVVVDVTREGVATLTIQAGHSGRPVIIHAPERHLETALPKAGGNVVILTGTHRFAKGRLLERDSKANRGVVQVYEDMNVVTTSLDDMAEWCGPLDDDDAMDHHF